MKKSKTLTVKGLITWLRRKPPDERYIWHQPTNCLMGQWLRASGVPDAQIWHRSVVMAKQPPFTHIALKTPSTFGAALRRAEAALLNDGR
jgi:hypothetical protein